MENIKLQIGLDVIRSYRRLAYDPWYALAEFIDNSTQSYRDHHHELNAAYAREKKKRLRVRIEYDRDADLLIVSDNAMGMSLHELSRALHIGKPPVDTRGRSQFGLGLKTAACWFGDMWSVRTKKLGETQGYKVTVEVEKVASEAEHELPTEVFEAPTHAHYTEIRIESLHQVLQGRRLGKTKESLRSMYRVDIRNKKLELFWDTTPLEWREEQEYLPLVDDDNKPLTDADGEPLVDDDNNVIQRLDFSFDVSGRTVSGWAGVLAPGFSSRGNAGFALVRRGRLIRGWPISWRPEAIFGPAPGRNDLINQRVTGEVHLDEFDVTHTKDDILWQEDEEDEVQEGIKKNIAPVLRVARDFRHAKPASEHVSRDHKLAMDALIEDSTLGAQLRATSQAVEAVLSAMTPSDVATLAATAMARVVGGEQPLLRMEMNHQPLSIFTTSKQGHTGPYLTATETQKEGLQLILNAAHPFCAGTEDVDALRVHVQHAVADGLLMWAFEAGRVVPQPAALLGFKDALLRSMSKEP
jgi:hypothetical protein